MNLEQTNIKLENEIKLQKENEKEKEVVLLKEKITDDQNLNGNENETKKEKENENKNSKNWNDILSISEKINVNLLSNIKINKDDEIKNKNDLLKEEKNTFITISGISEMASTNNPNKADTNKNTNISNNNIINNNKNINEVIIDNYLNTINVGYNDLIDNSDIKFGDEENKNNIECEPTPSFLLCLKKINNN